MKKINTQRFGEIEAGDDHFIEFKDGMIGLSSLKRYILIESPAYPLILWLQSCEDSGIAFPVIEPNFFKAGYKVTMTDADKHSLELIQNQNDRTKAFVVLTIPSSIEDMTVNLKAPVVVNLDKALATQVVMQDKELQVREPAFEAFSNAINSLAGEYAEDVWKPIRVRDNASSAGNLSLVREANV